MRGNTMANITAIKGDITQAKVDAIVNAANPVLPGGGGVDGAIYKVAGPKLLEACKEIELHDRIRCPTGEARITEAGNLNAKFVIHAVGPRYNADSRPDVLLSSAYKHALKLALDNKCNSIAFPAISCDAYGYPIKEAARTSIDICIQKQYRGNMHVYFYLYDDVTYKDWRNILDERIVKSSVTK
jgi:O-acetyl-ADP-ribose deacetylase (regulator of RNase III)